MRAVLVPFVVSTVIALIGPAIFITAQVGVTGEESYEGEHTGDDYGYGADDKVDDNSYVDAGYGSDVDARYGSDVDAGYGGDVDAGYGGDVDAGYGGDDDAGYGGDDDAGYGDVGYGGKEHRRVDTDDAEYGPPKSKALVTVAELEAFLQNEDASVIGAFSQEDAAYEEYNTLSTSLQYDFRWAHTFSATVLEHLKVMGPQHALLLYHSPQFVSEKHGDRPRVRFPLPTLDEDSVRPWLQHNSEPLVGAYTYTTKDRFIARKLPVVIVFCPIDFARNPKGSAYFLNRARKVAAELTGKLAFAVGSIEEHQGSLVDFGYNSVDTAHDVVVGLLHMEGSFELYFKSDASTFSEDALRTFAHAYLSGSLEPHKRVDTSADAEEAEAATIDESAVVSLDANNFDTIVRDPATAVMVAFYAPW